MTPKTIRWALSRLNNAVYHKFRINRWMIVGSVSFRFPQKQIYGSFANKTGGQPGSNMMRGHTKTFTFHFIRLITNFCTDGKEKVQVKKYNPFEFIASYHNLGMIRLVSRPLLCT